MRKSLIVLPLALGALALGFQAPISAGSKTASLANGDIQVFPYGLLDHVRNPNATVPMQVQIYNQGDSAVELTSLKVLDQFGNQQLEMPLYGERLPGDGGTVADAYLLMETVDPEIAHRFNDRVFIPLEERRELSPETEAILHRRLLDKVAEIKQNDGVQMKNARFELNLTALFPANPQAGAEAIYDVLVEYRDTKGDIHSATTSHVTTLVADFLPPPTDWSPNGNGTGRSAGAWYAGDFHVHNCRDEASNGCPDCDAEALNISGSFTNADLKSQFKALGFDFFSTTTHSYCINSDNEFNAVKNESNLLDEQNFNVVCGTEMTTREAGGQTGSDPLFDAQCLLVFHGGIAHYGGHNITSRKHGGEDGWLGYCLDPMNNAIVQMNQVNSEGGFSIANHPGGNVISNNSTAMFRGIEEDMCVGCEVWNADNSLGSISMDHRKWWIDRMLDGKYTYPASGSDTHDTAHHFGATHLWIDGPFNDDSIAAAMRSGKIYLSNGPFLSVSLADNNGHRVDMGGVAFAPRTIPHDYPVTVEVPYNLGSATGTLRVYRGAAGDNAEVLIQEFTNLAGQGTKYVSAKIPNPSRKARGVWYRAEFESTSAPQESAYTSVVIVAIK